MLLQLFPPTIFASTEANISNLDIDYVQSAMISSRTVVLKEGYTKALVNSVDIVMTNPAVRQNQITFVPIENISVLMGADVTYDGITLTVQIGNQKVTMQIGSPYLIKEAEDQPPVTMDLRDIAGLDEPIQVINDVPYAPVRAMMEILDCYVQWFIIPDASNVNEFFTVITMSEISIDEARDLAKKGQKKLTDSYIPTDGISIDR